MKLTCTKCRVSWEGILADREAMEHVRKAHKKDVETVSRKTNLTNQWAAREVYGEVIRDEAGGSWG